MNEVSKLVKIYKFTDEQWEALRNITKINKNPYSNLHIRLNMLCLVYKLEKSLRISNKLIEKLTVRLHYSTDIDPVERQDMIKKLEDKRTKNVEQQWGLYKVEKELKKR